MSDEALQEQLQVFHSVNFMVAEPWTWSLEPCLDSADVIMQMLSCLPRTLGALKSVNDYGASIVRQQPSRFGLLLALPTDDATACLNDIKRGDIFDISNDGYALLTVYNNVMLSDDTLEPVFKELQ